MSLGLLEIQAPVLRGDLNIVEYLNKMLRNVLLPPARAPVVKAVDVREGLIYLTTGGDSPE